MLTVRRYGRSSDLSGDVVRFIRFGSDYPVWLCWFRFQFGWFRPSSGKLKDVHSRIKIFAIISGSGPSLNMNTAMGDGANLPLEVPVCFASSLEACILRMALPDRNPPPLSPSDEAKIMQGGWLE